MTVFDKTPLEYPKAPGMVSLIRIIEPSLTRKITPRLEFRDLAIRADLIRTIEPAIYGSLWKFRGEDPNKEYSYPFISYRWAYWEVETFRSCLQLTVEDLGTIKVEGDFNNLLTAITREI